MIFSKRWLVIGLIGAAGAFARADEGQTSWLSTLAQKAVPQNSADDKPATVAGTRGLNEPSETVDTTARDDAAIDRLEKISVAPEALTHFIAEGKLQ